MRVFLSSTSRGLEEIRNRIESAVRKRNDDVNRMEFFGSRTEDPKEVCLQEVRRSDILVLYIGDLYGSIDDDTGLSFTHLEFREAVRHSIPVLAFVLKNVPTNDEPGKKRDAFVNEVGKTPGIYYDSLSSQDTLPENVVVELFNFVERQGETGRRFRVFPPHDVYFRGMLDREAIFNHTHVLAGRRDELQKLQAFLGADQTIMILSGPGGVGKTKLLYELAQWRSAQMKSPLPEIRFCQTAVPLFQEAFRELPSCDVCIIIEDAHRVQNLEDFLRTCLSPSNVRRVILSVRPGCEGLINSAVRSISPDQVVRIPVGELPRKTHALDLAIESLGPDHRAHANALVAAADGNPLIITVGGQCIRTEKISAGLLERSDDFVDAALTCLLDSIPAQIEGISRDQMLRVLAAIQPFQPIDEALREAIAEHLGCRQSAIVEAVEQLVHHKLILRRGGKARIVPDVLADHILYQACLTRQGEPKGFFEDVYHAFGDIHLANILLNGAELDWRTRVAGKAASVMSAIWRMLSAQLAELSYYARRQLLQALRQPANFAPGEVMEIVLACIDLQEAPPDEDEIRRLAGVEHTDVLASASEVLAVIGQNAEFTRRCTATLWKLAQQDDREPNPHPYHPFRVLKQFAAYRTDNDLRVIEAALDEIRAIIQRREHLSNRYPMVDIVMESLDREVEHVEYDRRTVTMGARPLALEKVRPQREKAIRILKDLGLGDDPSHATQAVQSLVNLVRPPFFNFGRETTPDDLAAFQPEAEEALKILIQIGQKSPFRVIRYLARRCLLEIDRREWPALREHLASSVSTIPSVEEELLIDALLDNPPGDCDLSNHDAVEAASEKAQHELARDLWTGSASPRDLLGQLAPIYDELLAACIQGSGRGPQSFVRALAATAGDRLDELAKCLLEPIAGRLRTEVAVALRMLRQSGKYYDFAEIVSRIAAAADVDMRSLIAERLAYLLHGDPEPPKEVLRLVELFVRDDDRRTRGFALSALRFFRTLDPRGAIELLIKTDWLGDSEIAEEALLAFTPGHGIDLAELKDEDIDKLLGKLSVVQAIDDHHYEINRVLSYSARRRPISVVRLLLNRIDRSATPQGRYSDGYRPMPYLANQLQLTAIADSEDYLPLLREIREHSLNESWEYHHYLPLLFRDVTRSSADAMAVVSEWALGDDVKKVVAAVRLLTAMESGVLWTRVDDIAKILENAHRLDRSCYEEVCGLLHVLASPKGARAIPHDAADPFYVQQCRQAEELAARFAGQAGAAKFFKELASDAARLANRIRREEDDE